MAVDDMKQFWSEGIRGLSPYVPGEQPRDGSVIKLNTNENPYPPSPQALAALREAANADLRLYPDPEGLALRRVIAARHALEPDNVFLGNGSDEVLAHAFLGLLRRPRPLLFPDVTYSFYPVYCSLYGIDYHTVPLGDDLAIRVDHYLRPAGGVVVANPNAPTGLALPLAALRRLLAGQPDAVVLVDEAYVDFGAESAVSLVREFRNLLVVQTLSKSRSLAGLRVGIAIGDADLIAALNTVKGCFNSYPLDRLALAGAQAALEDEAYFESTRDRIVRSRERLSTELRAMGFEVLPSSANFVFARHPAHAAAALRDGLRERAILVRHFTQPRIADYLRITVGDEQACASLLAALAELTAPAGA